MIDDDNDDDDCRDDVHRADAPLHPRTSLSPDG